MKFSRRAAGHPNRLGILPGTFNPVTVAHLALAQAALEHVDEIVFVLPRVFPHKAYTGASFDDRLEMLRLTVAGNPGYSVATAEGGLFVEIARECREAYGDQVRLAFLCGRDAAERIAGWEYGRPRAFAEMLREFDLLVAPRDGAYEPPAEFEGAVKCLKIDSVDAVSATEVRERIARGEPWEHLVPPAIHARALHIYRQKEPCNPRRSSYASFTRAGNTLYMHVHFWPGDTPIVAGLINQVKLARMPATGKEIKFEHDKLRVKCPEQR